MLSLGPIHLDVPFVQAALSGYSDLAMRRIAMRCGAPYTINEVMLDRLVVQPGKLQRQILAVPDDVHPVGGQLMGADPNVFAPAARALADAGYDVIDINFGCPVKKVLGRCRGGFMLSEPPRAIDIIRRVFDAVGATHPVTVKMRRGMDDSAESERNFFTILDAAFEIGVAAVTVHGRSVVQRYVGKSRWEFLAKVKQHVRELAKHDGRNGDPEEGRRRVDELDKLTQHVDELGKVKQHVDDPATVKRRIDDLARIKRHIGDLAQVKRHIGDMAAIKRHVGNAVILGSGDLFSAEACMRMIEETGVDGVTIARGAIGNPWIFQECRALYAGHPLPPPPGIAEQGRVIAEHFDECVKVHGHRLAGKIMRKFGIKYSEHHPCARQVRDAFIAASTPADVHAALARWYDPEADWPPVVRREGHGDLVAAGASIL